MPLLPDELCPIPPRPPLPLGEPPVCAELVPLAGWVERLLLALPAVAEGDELLRERLERPLPVGDVPAVALGDALAGSKVRSWLRVS